MTHERVVVAMSGGVDSSVAAALLLERGYDVVGMMMRLWSESGRENDNRCCTPDAMAMARRVAAQLGIPFYAVDAQAPFYNHVVRYFQDSYLAGLTPNPCLVCNRRVRWEFLLDRALALDAAYLATGHYVRLSADEQDRYQILKAVDANKDQSYVLHTLSQEQLHHACFPLGELTKPEVREAARRLRLPVADRPDSQDLCFLGNEDYRSFLRRNVPQVENPGPILTNQGDALGQHNGLAFYTIGQRKGLGLPGGPVYYVLEKDQERNALIVGSIEELGQDTLFAGPINWISGIAPDESLRAEVKIRYKAAPAPAWVYSCSSGMVKIVFDHPLRDITPGQAAVIYQGDVCLGGGIIQP